MRRNLYRRARTDYPTGVLAIYDNPRETDRYTVVYMPNEYLGELWFSFAGIDQDGMGFHGEARNHERPRSSWGNKNGCGKVIAFEAMPAEAQAFVMADLALDAEWGRSDEADDMLAAIQHN